MSKQTWKRDEPDSPCQSICVIHPTAGICIGCHRTAEEVSKWGRFEPEVRQKLLAELPSRSHLLRKRRGGKRGRTR